MSPHPDDVCLSLAGLVSEMSVPGRMLTVFGASMWAEPSWQGPRTAEELTAIRAREDAEFGARTGLPGVAMGLPDTSLRHSRTWDLRSPTGRERELRRELERTLARMADDEGFDVLVAPLGLGRHADHVVCAEAARNVAAGRRMGSVFYEDAPYAAETSEHHIARQTRRVARGLRPVVVHSGLAMEEKLSLARIYETQADAAMLEGMVRLSRRLDGAGPAGGVERVSERIWTRDPEALVAMVRDPSAVTPG